MKTRNKSYDAIAGIMVSMAILLHIGYASFSQNNILHYFGFFMIWFFYKAGMFHNPNPKYDKTYWIKMSKRLVIPFLATGYLGFTVFALCTNMSLKEYLLSLWWPIGVAIRGNGPSWFLITFVIVKLLFPLIVKNVKGNWLWGIVLGFFCLSVFLHYTGITKKVTIMNTSMSMIFCTLGFLMKEEQYKRTIFISSVIVYIVLCFGFPSEINLATTDLAYGNFIVSIFYNAAGIFVINNVFTKLSFLQLKSLCYIGRHSMTYFLFHMPILHIMNMFREEYGYGMETDKLLKITAILLFLPIIDYIVHHPRLKMKWIVGE